MQKIEFKLNEDKELIKAIVDELPFLSRHDIEKILDEVVFIDNGEIILQDNADELRKKENGSIDEIFRRKFYVG